MATTAQRLAALEAALAALKTADGNLGTRITNEVNARATAVTALDGRLKTLETEAIPALELHGHPNDYAELGHTHTMVEPLPDPLPEPTPEPTPTPAPSPALYADMPGIPGSGIARWELGMAEYFQTAIARGQFHDPVKIDTPTGPMYRSRDGKFLINPETWKDTRQRGRYDPNALAVIDGNLDILLQADPLTGEPRVCALKPLAPWSDPLTAGIVGPFRYELEMRADRITWAKGVPMIWSTRPWRTIPGAVGPDDVKYLDGEGDWPEGDFNGKIAAFFHYPNITKTTQPQQDWYPTPAGTTWQDWHKFALEFDPGIRIAAYLDGQLIGDSRQRVMGGAPSYRPNLQFECQLHDGWVFDPTSRGSVQIRRMALWRGIRA